MKKEVENKLCGFCESEYKLSYTAEDVSGFPKFCPFCGSETEEDYEENEDMEEE